MGDIISLGNKYKKVIKIADGWIRKKLGASEEQVITDLNACGNPIFYRINKLLDIASDSVKEKYQKRMIRSYGKFILWILYKDTAYRDPTFWIFNQILEHAEEIKKELKPYVKEPHDWYVNSWHDSKEHTKEERKKGTVVPNRKAEDESIFTPPEQQRRLNKYNKKRK